jgi:hypothetical protein
VCKESSDRGRGRCIPGCPDPFATFGPRQTGTSSWLRRRRGRRDSNPRPHLGKVVLFVYLVSSRPLMCGSLRTVSIQSIGYVCVVERSTIERNMKGVTIWWAELGKSILRQREILLEDDVRPSWFVNDYGKQSSEKDFGFRIELRWHQLDRRHRFRERHAVDRGAMQRHHLTKVAFMKGVYGM